ncbi:MAG TPA: carboxypeptidase regulatory-like domain-containing protein, partial [Candidatus Elarobacter sp.]|nr:carboxypeptidase regulatory-like domain-containing protein [Candidatus Elarobacter sp.]
MRSHYLWRAAICCFTISALCWAGLPALSDGESPLPVAESAAPAAEPAPATTTESAAPAAEPAPAAAEPAPATAESAPVTESAPAETESPLPVAASAVPPIEPPPVTVAQAAAPTAVVQGSVRTTAGTPIAGAIVALSGPATARTTTDADGAFTVTVPPGVYRIDVTRPGYVPAVLSDFAVVAGTTVPVTVALNQASLTSLQQIGRVSTVSRGSRSAINTGTATSNYLTGQAFGNLGNPQVNDVLQHLPDVTIERMGSQQDTSIIVGGVQPYETQVLIDGHPLALGQYGVWVSTYYPSYLSGGV